MLSAVGSSLQAEDILRVMTFNLRYASAAEDQGTWKQWDSPIYVPQRRQFVCRVITNHQPDVIGFQEGEDGQLNDLRTNLPSLYALERQKPSGGGGNENAAFAWNTNRLDLLDRGVFSLGPAPGGGYWNNPPGTNFDPYVFFPGMGLNFPRLALWGRFRWRATGREFLFYTTHFDFNDGPQVGSARLITDDARARNDRMPLSPLAVAVGDFNATQAGNAWKLFTGAYTNNGITGDFTDAWWQVRGTWDNSGTLHGFNGGIRPASDRIDWILHRGGFVATQAVIVTDSTTATNQSNGTTATMFPSDHYPVLAVLRFPAPSADHDGDGLPDAVEFSAGRTQPADADTDGDGLLDGLEDLNGNGVVDGGETDPAGSNATVNLPTDLRYYQMDGVLDHGGLLAAENGGMTLYHRFDGRYLYVATWDAGEGQDHFIFITRNPDDAVAAPWAKTGQVARWDAFLADENDNTFRGWFDAAQAQITNHLQARAATYYQNGGRLEGVIDLAGLYGTGFTQAVYLAVAPYATADGGVLGASWQVPAGNGDGNLLGTNELYRITPGDQDGDGINDRADPDADGDGLPDAWEQARLGNTDYQAQDDPDHDGAVNFLEWLACTDPTNGSSVFRIHTLQPSASGVSLRFTVTHGKTSTLYRADSVGLTNGLSWTSAQQFPAPTNFPAGTNLFESGTEPPSRFFRISLTPR